MSFTKLFILLSATLFCSLSPAANKCAQVFAKRQLTPALRESIDRSILDLAKLRLSIDQSQAQGKNSVEQTALQVNYKDKEAELIAYLQTQSLMSQEQLKERIVADIFVLQQKPREEENTQARRVKKEQQSIHEKFDPAKKMIFNRIGAGSFMMREGTVAVTLTKPFEMMATPVTQLFWKSIANMANKHPKMILKFNPDPSTYKGDTNPLESASLGEVNDWIKALNQLSKWGENSLEDLIPGHQTGNIYRLPTEAEWEYVALGARDHIEMRKFLPTIDWNQYAWTSENSGNKTQPVATKSPLAIEGGPFYDLYGNVWERVSDSYEDNIPGGQDPQVKNNTPYQTVKGGPFNMNHRFMFASSRTSTGPNFVDRHIGFRLVREVQP